MRCMLDTNICIYLIKRAPMHMLARLEKMRVSDVAVSAITVSELEYGVEKSAFPMRNRIALAQFLTPLEVLPYTAAAAYQYGRLRSALEARGQVIGALDMLIAAHALSLHYVLVTNNEDEFRRIAGLHIENWTK